MLELLNGLFTSGRKSANLKSRAPIKGVMTLTLRDSKGRIKEQRRVENTITELMDAHVADQMSDSGDAAIGFMAVGTGTGQTSASTGLAVSLDRNALTSTTQQGAGDDNDVIYVGDWAAGDGTGSITEAGIFLSDNNTTMMTYASFAVVTKAAGDTLQINWTVTFGAS